MTRLTTVPPGERRPAGGRDPYLRLNRLLDTGSLRRVHPEDDLSAVAVRGRVAGAEVIAFCAGGEIGMGECLRIAHATDLAAAEDRPVIGVWHPGGTRLDDGVEALDGAGRVFAAMVRASGKVPQISVVLGPAAHGAAYGPALTDLVIVAPDGRGPLIDPTGFGAEPQARHTGVVHMVAGSRDEALDEARRLIALLTRPGRFDPAPPAGLPPDAAPDPRALLRALLDGGELTEMQRHRAPGVVIGLGRLAGGTIGVVAGDPRREGGTLDGVGAEKVARFVRMCDSLGIPLVVVFDAPGELPSAREEWDGVMLRGAKLLYAFAEAVVPRVTLITGRSADAMCVALNSRSLGATKVFAWPDADVAAMGDARYGVVDEVVTPGRTREKIAAALTAGVRRRGRHGNIPL
ncbi:MULTISPECIES: carboxyl transferase domain-containing protein [Actinomadura]|uniref:Acyl-CoA carboxylase subunit beta n=1 Tax=Actinomadura litoris TaxID=2678616 RepID=A0A7K1KX21_9ACTN|nr:MULTISPECIES: carboxyl transferase domain-containing protein [Actinomadura]MBT2210856.1 acyl-CoA carboxylase subunit beta [Actinomadura sp. NEAU-AAG7]MUN36750.1 acyl-CoA carboxylase subunit beta [Actinomadura litoris]